MIKSMKHILMLAVIPLLFAGCDDLFDKGDTDKAYDGPDQVAWNELEAEITEGESYTLEVQFISSEGLAPSDVSVTFSVGGSFDSGSATVTSSPVTISSGSASVTVTVETSDSDLDEDAEATIELTIDSADGAQVAPNLSTSTIFVTGV
jgi:hypothetical protein